MMLTKNNIAVVSDLHIGTHQNDPLWHMYAMKFAEWFRDEISKKGIKDIVICGDINNDRDEISVSSLHVLGKIFETWKDFNILLIVGNHDAYYKDRSDVNSLSLFSGWPNITIIDKLATIEKDGRKLSFAPWGTTLEEIPKSDILFGHFEINGFYMSKAKCCLTGFDSKNILEKSPLIISGHFHMREERKYKDIGEILFVGSPYEQSWGDYGTSSRGFYTLDVSTGKYEFIENTLSPKHKKIRLSEIMSAEKITDSIRKDLKGNIVQLLVDQDIPQEKVDKLVVLLSSLGTINIKTEYVLEERFSVEESTYNFDAVDIPASITEFVNIMDGLKYKEDVLKYVIELYKECSNE